MSLRPLATVWQVGDPSGWEIHETPAEAEQRLEDVLEVGGRFVTLTLAENDDHPQWGGRPLRLAVAHVSAIGPPMGDD